MIGESRKVYNIKEHSKIIKLLLSDSRIVANFDNNILIKTIYNDMKVFYEKSITNNDYVNLHKFASELYKYCLINNSIIFGCHIIKYLICIKNYQILLEDNLFLPNELINFINKLIFETSYQELGLIE